jgi:hypothetical protein
MRQYTISQFVRNAIFMTAIFMLREIDGAFNITKELRMVIILSVVFE